MFQVSGHLERLCMMFGLPRVSIDLMCRATVGNEPFYRRVVEEFYAEATRRHPKFPLVGAMQFGVALHLLPRTFDLYFMRIEASARRNHKKAMSHECHFRQIDYNDHLNDISDIRRSTDIRQGQLSQDFLCGEVQPCANPRSRTTIHDYSYFGVFRDDRMVAYAGCLIAGELCMIEHIYGHAGFQSMGVTPMLVIEMARHVIERHPVVRFYAYGMLLGASESMWRFKKKLGFLPYRVDWLLGDGGARLISEQLVFRRSLAKSLSSESHARLNFVFAGSALALFRIRHDLLDCLGVLGALKAILKVATHRRCFYAVQEAGVLVHYGWLSVSFCRYYAVNRGDVVVGPIWTKPSVRSRGIGAFALCNAMNVMYRHGHSVFFIDTTSDNYSCLRVIEKCGFGEIYGTFVKRH